jgi:hypothetical protein
MSLARAPKSSCAELLVGSSLCIDGVWLEVRSGWRQFSISIGTRATSGSSSKSENEDRCIALRPDAGRGAGTAASRQVTYDGVSRMCMHLAHAVPTQRPEAVPT